MALLKHLKYFRQNRLPGQLVIQLTDRCNALCPQCGMRVTNDYPRSRLTTDEVKQILDHAAANGVRAVSFTGGEPLLYLNELIELINYAGQAGIEYTRTGTNGFIFKQSDRSKFQSQTESLARRLADTPLRNFWISIDSAVPTVHEKMRGFPGVVDGIRRALPIFHQHGVYPSANLGINRNIAGEARARPPRQSPDESAAGSSFYHEFKSAFEKFYRFAIDLGFTMVNTCYPMSVCAEADGNRLQPVYAATSGDDIVRFSRSEKAQLFRALLDTIPQFRSRIRIFSPLSALYSLYQQYNGGHAAYPCRGGLDFIYIDSKDGHAYPCGYRGSESFGPYRYLVMDAIKSNGACYLCDWECFRDPSDLMGPFLEGMSKPLSLAKRVRRDRQFFRLWLEDIKYYQACRLFDSRRPPDFTKLLNFKQPSFTISN